MGLLLPACLLLSGGKWDALVASNVFLGLQQGFAWTTNIFMLMDLYGAYSWLWPHAHTHRDGYASQRAHRSPSRGTADPLLN